jgi:hypothetical protein
MNMGVDAVLGTEILGVRHRPLEAAGGIFWHVIDVYSHRDAQLTLRVCEMVPLSTRATNSIS